MDRWLPELSGAELKVLLYLARRTFGFHRNLVEVGLRRICTGIPGKDRGTGLHIETASAAVKGLEAKGLVIIQRNPGGRTTYTLPVASGVYGKSEHSRSENPDTPVYGKAVHVERKSSSTERYVQKQIPSGRKVASEAATAPRPNGQTRDTSLKADDEKQNDKPRAYASPEAELHDIFRTKTGAEITRDLLARLREICELRGVTLKQYVEALRAHVPNAWRNPAGFLTDFARKIRSKTASGCAASDLLGIDPMIRETPRCGHCRGTGLQSAGYCDCQLGLDLRVQAQRRSLAESAPAFTAHALLQK